MTKQIILVKICYKLHIVSCHLSSLIGDFLAWSHISSVLRSHPADSVSFMLLHFLQWLMSLILYKSQVCVNVMINCTLWMPFINIGTCVLLKFGISAALYAFKS